MNEDENRRQAQLARDVAALSLWMLLILSVLVALGLWGCPHYGVWNAKMDGKAKAAEAVEIARGEKQAQEIRDAKEIEK